MVMTSTVALLCYLYARFGGDVYISIPNDNSARIHRAASFTWRNSTVSVIRAALAEMLWQVNRGTRNKIPSRRYHSKLSKR